MSHLNDGPLHRFHQDTCNIKKHKITPGATESDDVSIELVDGDAVLTNPKCPIFEYNVYQRDAGTIKGADYVLKEDEFAADWPGTLGAMPSLVLAFATSVASDPFIAAFVAECMPDGQNLLASCSHHRNRDVAIDNEACVPNIRPSLEGLSLPLMRLISHMNSPHVGHQTPMYQIRAVLAHIMTLGTEANPLYSITRSVHLNRLHWAIRVGMFYYWTNELAVNMYMTHGYLPSTSKTPVACRHVPMCESQYSPADAFNFLNEFTEVYKAVAPTLMSGIKVINSDITDRMYSYGRLYAFLPPWESDAEYVAPRQCLGVCELLSLPWVSNFSFDDPDEIINRTYAIKMSDIMIGPTVQSLQFGMYDVTNICTMSQVSRRYCVNSMMIARRSMESAAADDAGIDADLVELGPVPDGVKRDAVAQQAQSNDVVPMDVDSDGEEKDPNAIYDAEKLRLRFLQDYADVPPEQAPKPVAVVIAPEPVVNEDDDDGDDEDDDDDDGAEDNENDWHRHTKVVWIASSHSYGLSTDSAHCQRVCKSGDRTNAKGRQLFERYDAEAWGLTFVTLRRAPGPSEANCPPDLVVADDNELDIATAADIDFVKRSTLYEDGDEEDQFDERVHNSEDDDDENEDEEARYKKILEQLALQPILLAAAKAKRKATVAATVAARKKRQTEYAAKRALDATNRLAVTVNRSKAAAGHSSRKSRYEFQKWIDDESKEHKEGMVFTLTKETDRAMEWARASIRSNPLRWSIPATLKKRATAEDKANAEAVRLEEVHMLINSYADYALKLNNKMTEGEVRDDMVQYMTNELANKRFDAGWLTFLFERQYIMPRKTVRKVLPGGTKQKVTGMSREESTDRFVIAAPVRHEMIAMLESETAMRKKAMEMYIAENSESTEYFAGWDASKEYLLDVPQFWQLHPELHDVEQGKVMDEMNVMWNTHGRLARQVRSGGGWPTMNGVDRRSIMVTYRVYLNLMDAWQVLNGGVDDPASTTTLSETMRMAASHALREGRRQLHKAYGVEMYSQKRHYSAAQSHKHEEIESGLAQERKNRELAAQRRKRVKEQQDFTERRVKDIRAAAYADEINAAARANIASTNEAIFASLHGINAAAIAAMHDNH